MKASESVSELKNLPSKGAYNVCKMNLKMPNSILPFVFHHKIGDSFKLFFKYNAMTFKIVVNSLNLHI